MRTAPVIFEKWNAGGPFIGDDGAPHGRVTVEEGWELRLSGTSNVVGSYQRGPIRWFQRAANNQTETEVPNIKIINIERSLDTDAATCTITIQNTRMLNDGDAPADADEVGSPGYYTFNRGESAESQSRWNHSVNAWNRVLVPNALLRTYQGYGGKSKTIAQALDDGNIIQTGLWLIDQVSPQTGGDLVLTCRDMGKLLVEQSLYPPLVPKGIYQHGLYYYRWVNQDHPPIPYGTSVYGVGYTGTPAGQTSTGAPSVDFEVSSGSYSGHPGDDACDFGDATTYWLSSGSSTDTGFNYIQFVPHGGGTMDMGAFDLLPWGGGYDVYVSVMVGGVWQGSNTIPAPSPMNIHYVMHTTTQGWEKPFLDRINGGPYLNAQRIRLTFSSLVHSSLGPPFYRSGVRDFTVGTFTGTVTGGGRTIVGMARPYDVDGGTVGADSTGYWLGGSDGGVYSFGTARFWGALTGRALAAPISGIASQGLNGGYWLVGQDGGVFAFHSAHFYGSLPSIGVTPSAPVIAIERSPGGAGYYLADKLGSVYAFGDAAYHGNGSFGVDCVGMAVRPGGGYWLVDKDGHVDSFGSASYHGGAGGVAASGSVVGISGTSTGNGYWIVANDGAVFAYGDAHYHGGANSLSLADPISGIQGYADNGGYWLVAQDGGVFAYGGENNFWGSLPQSFDIETTGNYDDWTDILKDLLLWSGFWLYQSGLTGAPEVFGNIEDTGAFAPDVVGEDFFDKKPVIDVIHTIREIVGYLVYIDDQGGFHFHPPNIFAIGNFLEDGTATDTVPEIDEAVIITNYQVAYSDKDAVTSITVSTDDPAFSFNTTVSTTRTSTTGEGLLKGIVKNALWVNGAFSDSAEQNVLAELIDLYLFMAERQGSVTIYGNPAININDQVRIFERQTAETYIHYVSGISSTMDLTTGQYDMTLTTHWLGDGSAWFLTYD